MIDPTDLLAVTPTVDCRAVSFENATGARGAGGRAAGGRKGSPSRRIGPGSRTPLCDLAGPGAIRHVWLTIPPAPPEVMRAVVLEIFHDDLDEPSVSVPVVDFFGVPWGRPVHVATALTSIQEGRGFNSYIPIAFDDRIRIDVFNGSERTLDLYYQLDLTLEPERPVGTAAKLHATFRRQNPTVLQDDFVICEGLRGPGRFLGCVVGVRTLTEGLWYGEGEVKVYLDGDDDLPTICGTGLEDYVGTAWGMGPHQAPYQGSPLDVRPPNRPAMLSPDFVGFYRWHVPDPIMFAESLKVTIQQIGFQLFVAGEAERLASTVVAGNGWVEHPPPGALAAGIAERVDDYCATAFVLCSEAQPIPRVDVAAAIADIERREYEQPSSMEAFMSGAAYGA
jgi:D-arabinan exo alpha-(1,3)/(1,5)-arabinofuranosidase (non-reducing end)